MGKDKNRYSVGVVEFKPGGFTGGALSLYAIIVRDRVYVGMTGTSSGTGVSSPYKRLATHLRKNGNTKSCIWETSSKLQCGLNPAESLGLTYLYVQFPKGIEWGQVRCLEWQVINCLKERNIKLLNINKKKPKVWSTGPEDWDAIRKDFIEQIFSRMK